MERLSALASRISLTGLAIAILAALLAVQTVRLEGFKLWPLAIEGARPTAARLALDLQNVRQAQGIALERAQAAKLKAETDYRTLAERIDTHAEQQEGAAMAAADRYIAANRVRCEAAGGSRGRPAAAPGDHRAGRGEAPGQTPELDAGRGVAGDAGGLVLVAPEDVRICTANTLQAEAARDWAIGLEKPGGN